jgi:hypothetical protein
MEQVQVYSTPNDQSTILNDPVFMWRRLSLNHGLMFRHHYKIRSILMKVIRLLSALLISVAVFSQVRMISHISKTSGGFTPGVIVSNLDSSVHTFTLTAYLQNGNPRGSVTGNLNGGESRTSSLTELFSTEDVSHITISAHNSIVVSTTYESTSGEGSPAHVHESSIQSKRWLIYPGDWDAIWDGMAVVNTGGSSTDVTVTQKSKSGSMINSVTALSSLDIMAKGLFVFGSSFTQIDGSYFEITAQQPLAITSLRGSKNNQFLWENAAVTTVNDSSFSSTYTMIDNLNYQATDLTSNWLRLNTAASAHSFMKARDETVIEVQINSRIFSGTFDNAIGILLEIRVDGQSSLLGNNLSMLQSDTPETLTLFAAFEHLSAGSHTVSVWARAFPEGAFSSGVYMDPGGLGGYILVKETM